MWSWSSGDLSGLEGREGGKCDHDHTSSSGVHRSGVTMCDHDHNGRSLHQGRRGWQWCVIMITIWGLRVKEGRQCVIMITNNRRSMGQGWQCVIMITTIGRSPRGSRGYNVIMITTQWWVEGLSRVEGVTMTMWSWWSQQGVYRSRGTTMMSSWWWSQWEVHSTGSKSKG